MDFHPTLHRFLVSFLLDTKLCVWVKKDKVAKLFSQGKNDVSESNTQHVVKVKISLVTSGKISASG